jgi:phospholipase A2
MKKPYIVHLMLVFMIPLNTGAFDFTAQAKKFVQNSIDATKNMSNKLSAYIQNIENPIEKYKLEVREKYPLKEKLSKESVQVRQEQTLCSSELTFIKNRTSKTKQALKKHFDIDTPLKIGLCFSGGGNCAMLVTLGFLLEAETMGLFDAALYTAGSSGSTWTIVPFAYCNASQNMSLTGFKDQLTPRISSLMKPMVKNTPEVPVFDKYQQDSTKNNMLKHFAYDQYLTSVDVYSSFVGNYTLWPAGNKRLDVTWSSIANTIKKGTIPLPLGSAVAYKPSPSSSDSKKAHNAKVEYYWFEVGPFEVGSDEFKAYVPTQVFGSKFKAGKLVDGYQGHAPEYSISHYEAVFGSAFACSVNEAFNFFTRVKTAPFGKKLSQAMQALISHDTAECTRISPATFHNYTYGLQGHALANKETLSLYDGIMDFNFPLPILMRPARQLDLIIVCDVDIDFYSLQQAAMHCKRNDIKFPDLSDYTEEMLSKRITVLNDPTQANYDKEIITIIYCPFVKNENYSTTFDPVQSRAEGFCKTFNFNYTKDQAEQVISVTRHNLNDVKDKIKAVLKALEQQKTS